MDSKKVIILHDEVQADCRADELDNLAQAQAVSAALKNLGFMPESLAFSRQGIEKLKVGTNKPRFVFNLVETVEGKSSLCFMAGKILDRIGLHYTGSGPIALFISTNKVISKRVLHSYGIRTPEWIDHTGVGEMAAGTKYLLKPISEEGSIGIRNDSIVACESFDQLIKRLKQSTRTIGECFAERYIEGREFNVSLLGDKGEPIIMPVAEMQFLGYEERSLPKIVHYDAKWNPYSFEYQHTTRTFEIAKKDESLIREMSQMAKKCWHVLGLKGYARVDFRVDTDCKPWVIDVNSNPCIAKGGGFVAAAEKAGFGYDEMIKKIVDDSVSK